MLCWLPRCCGLPSGARSDTQRRPAPRTSLLFQNQFYAAINCGAILSATVVVNIQTNVSPCRRCLCLSFHCISSTPAGVGHLPPWWQPGAWQSTDASS